MHRPSRLAIAVLVAWPLVACAAPPARRIAFQSSRDGNDEIYVMNADGSGQTRLTNSAECDGKPAWSPE